MATEWRGYFYIEDVGLTAQQRQTLINTFKAWGMRNDSVFPHERNHWRIRQDQKAVIFEAVFDADNLTILWVRTKLAEIFSVPVGDITNSQTSTEYGPLWTFKYQTVNKLRLGIFGGLSATWPESQAATSHFLLDNAAQWNGVMQWR